MAFTAADVPGRVDVVINGEGFVFADTEDRRAAYTYSPTFVQRTNVEGDYGDSQQDFWLTLSQRDWSLGEQQKFFRQSGAQSRRCWRGSNVDVRTPGQVTLRPRSASAAFTQAVSACRAGGNSFGSIYAAGASNLFSIATAGTVTNHGAHGLGATPATFGLVGDGGNDIYLSTEDAGTVGVRKFNGAAFSTFSGSPAASLAYVNNTLYGFRPASGQLGRYDTSGTYTTLYTWREADGAGRDFTSLGGGILREFGSKLLILLPQHTERSELYLYDGTAPTLIYQLPTGFIAGGLEVSQGIVFIYGLEVALKTGSTYKVRPTIYFYANGSPGLLWRADTTMDYTVSVNFVSGPHPACVAHDAGIVFNDDTTGRFMVYNISDGGVHGISTYTVAGDTPRLASCPTFVLHTRNQTTGYRFPDAGTTATTGYITTSLADYDSSLSKNFHGITVDFIEASDGDGGSVDIEYRLNDLDGAYTSLRVDAVSGTEYELIGVSGRSITPKAVLNKGTSTDGPILKRVYVRASPVQPSFRQVEYFLNVTGRNGKSPVVLRDGTHDTRDGQALAALLVTAATSSSPITITDKFGTFTGIIEASSTQIIEIRPEEYMVAVKIREV